MQQLVIGFQRVLPEKSSKTVDDLIIQLTATEYERSLVCCLIPQNDAGRPFQLNRRCGLRTCPKASWWWWMRS